MAKDAVRAARPVTSLSRKNTFIPAGMSTTCHVYGLSKVVYVARGKSDGDVAGSTCIIYGPNPPLNVSTVVRPLTTPSGVSIVIAPPSV